MHYSNSPKETLLKVGVEAPLRRRPCQTRSGPGDLADGRRSEPRAPTCRGRYLSARARRPCSRRGGASGTFSKFGSVIFFFQV
jgi:hypothetical protein